MGLIKNTLRYLSGGQQRQEGLQDPNPQAYTNEAATSVTGDTALQLSAVWSCVRLISESIGTLPIKIYKLSDGGVKTPFPEHPLSRLFRNKVNRWQTRQELIECLVYQFAMQGNDYSVIHRNSRKEIIGIEPLMSTQMQVELINGAPRYTYYTGSKQVNIDENQIWHNKLYGNGIVGLSPIGFARNVIGLGQAAEKATTKIYKNGGKPSGLLTIDRVLGDEQRKAIKKNFAELAEGNEDRLFVLEAAMNYSQVSLSPQDIELLQSRRYQIEDICRFFLVPSILVNDNHDNTAWGSGISEIIQGFYKFGLRPYAKRYELSMMTRLLNASERDTMRIEFDFNDILQPSLADRIKSGKEAVTGGLKRPNEWRNEEGLEPVDGGDSIYMQQQMVPIELLKDLDRSKVSSGKGSENAK